MLARRAPLVAAAVALVLVILLIVLLVLPKMHQVTDANSALDAAKAKQQTLITQKAALEQAKTQAPRNRAIIQNVQRQLPPTADEPGMLRLMSNAATRAGIKLWAFTPSTPVPGTSTGGTSTGTSGTAGLTQIPVAFTVKGSYFAMAEFLYNLETLPRVAKVQSVSLSSGGAATTSSVPFLQMTGSVTFYTTAAAAGPGTAPGTTGGSGTGSGLGT